MVALEAPQGRQSEFDGLGKYAHAPILFVRNNPVKSPALSGSKKGLDYFAGLIPTQRTARRNEFPNCESPLVYGIIEL